MESRSALPTPLCEVVIFNFGRSIAETFASLAAGDFTRQQIQPYIDLHHRRRLFTPGWRTDDLHTLIALQENVSTKNLSPQSTRGSGTVELIEFFQRVHEECNGQAAGQAARLQLASGSTGILFDGTYRMAQDPQGAKRIAFNANNDLKGRPDDRYVRHLRGVSFPGTLIAIRFPMSTERSTVAAQGEAP